MQIKHEIFKAYDIRGLVDGELSDKLAYRLGRAFVVLLKKKGLNLEKKAIVVGRDMRASSLGFQSQVMEGVTDEGVEAVDIGLCSTPLFNFATAEYPEHAGGIMVTASHNPAEYNGFKITFEDGLPLGGQTGMDELRHLISEYSFVNAEKKGKTVIRKITDQYLAKIFKIAGRESIKPVKVVVDGGNGMAAAVLPQLVDKLEIDADYLYMEPDGTFPNHEANPLKVETLRDLQAKVLAVKADFGMALDGDADRIGLVDEKGNVVEASFVGALLGLQVLRKKGSGNMYYDLRSSMIVPELWRKNGGNPRMCMVGHALIKKLMKEKPAVFASELSMHFYYGDLYNLESADLTLLFILQMLSREGKTLSQLVEPMKKYFHSGEKNFQVENKEEVIAELKNVFSVSARMVSRLDGLYMKFDWGWFNVRESNTEAVLRLNLEAVSSELMREKLNQIEKLIRERKRD